MFRAAVPEASVHADGETVARKQDVDAPTWEPCHLGMHPITQAARVQDPSQGELRGRSRAAERGVPRSHVRWRRFAIGLRHEFRDHLFCSAVETRLAPLRLTGGHILS